MTQLPWSMALLLLLIVIPAAVSDLRSRRIPNWLTLTGVLLGIGMNTFLSGGNGLKASLGGLAFGFIVYFILYLIHAMGAGDAKLMAAVGSIVGPSDWFGIFILSALIGGIFGLVLLLSKGRLRRTLWNITYILSEFSHLRAPYLSKEELDVKSSKAVTLPHGFTIALGSVLFLVASTIWSPK